MNQVVLRTVNLTRRYGSLTAVDHLSLEVFEGEVFGFLGPNGAGKTTSINMMCGLLKPDEGEVWLHGKTIASAGAEVRSRVGVCPQEVVLWERLTCLEQLEFTGEMYGMSRRDARRSGERLLEELELREKSRQQARYLSGGMKRRLNLALALVHDPEVVVLDEPEAGLDPQSRVRVREYIQSLARRKTVILTTHNMDEAERLADRVAIIDHGVLLVLDTPENLKQRLGAGDVVEVDLRDTNGDLSLVKEQLQGVIQEITMDGASRTLRLRLLNAVGHLPRILETLAEAGFGVGDVNLRSNTLEDVFIQLTGRRLRE
jgi:ABC-2 type transport system ATP-binding protein